MEEAAFCRVNRGKREDIPGGPPTYWSRTSLRQWALEPPPEDRWNQRVASVAIGRSSDRVAPERLYTHPLRESNGADEEAGERAPHRMRCGPYIPVPVVCCEAAGSLHDYGQQSSGLHVLNSCAACGCLRCDRRSGRHDDRTEQGVDRCGRSVLRRSGSRARLRWRDRRAVKLWAARKPSERGWHDAQAQGVLCRRVGRSGRGASRLRPLRGEAGAEGPPEGGTGPRAWRSGGEGCGGRCLADCGV